MAQDQLAGLATTIKGNTQLNAKLKSAKNIDDIVAALKTEGIITTKAALMKSQANNILQLSDAELESANINVGYTTDTGFGCVTWVAGCCP